MAIETPPYNRQYNCYFRLMRYFLFSFCVISLLFNLLAFFFMQPLDTTPYQKTSFYKNQLATIAALKKETTRQDSLPLEIGWAGVSLVPPFTTPLCIAVAHNNKHWNRVHDSVSVRVFVFKQGEKKVAFVSVELLIVPPLVMREIDSTLAKEGFSQANIYYTATHTHSSIGSWHPSPVGEIFAGKYDDRVPKFLATKIAQAVKEAAHHVLPATVKYAAIPARNFVFNRLVHDAGEVDSMLRVVYFTNAQKEQAALYSFAAHATCLHQHARELSGDWPALFLQKMQADFPGIFFCYAAGAVGSHGPKELGKNPWQNAFQIADGLQKIACEALLHQELNNPNKSPHTLRFAHVPLYLREPNFRITTHFVLRPAWFRFLFGCEPTYINFLQLGDVKFIGMPCDFSGELTDDVGGQNTLITSFNGGFVGYITADKHYALNTYETRTMNWFGPDNGKYFTEVARMLLK